MEPTEPQQQPEPTPAPVAPRDATAIRDDLLKTTNELLDYDSSGDWSRGRKEHLLAKRTELYAELDKIKAGAQPKAKEDEQKPEVKPEPGPQTKPAEPDAPVEIKVENVSAEHRAEAEQFAADVGAMAADLGVPAEEAQAIFDCAVDISLSNQQAGLDLQNVSACRAALEHRYGANSEGIVRDAQAAVKRLGPDVAAYLDHTGAGNDPGVLLTLAEYYRGTTRLSPEAAAKELVRVRADKNFWNGDKYLVDRARLLGTIAARSSSRELQMPVRTKPVAATGREKLEGEQRTIRQDKGYWDRSAPNHRALQSRMAEIMRELHGGE
jgi:hypothetical protein